MKNIHLTKYFYSELLRISDFIFIRFFLLIASLSVICDLNAQLDQDIENSFVNLSGTPEYRKAAPVPLGGSSSQLPNLSRGKKDEVNPLDIGDAHIKRSGYEASRVTMAETPPYINGNNDKLSYRQRKTKTNYIENAFIIAFVILVLIALLYGVRVSKGNFSVNTKQDKINLSEITMSSIIQEISKLNELKEKGALTEDEFTELKKRILNSDS
jgi:hypothetical protein